MVSQANVSDDICNFKALQKYDLWYHIFGLFMVLGLSSLGTFGTILLGERRKVPIIAKILQLFKMFGIGIIAATAWIHLLPNAFEKFFNPCLGDPWKEYGTNYVELFALLAAFFVQLIELGASDHEKKYDPSTGGYRTIPQSDTSSILTLDVETIDPEYETSSIAIKQANRGRILTMILEAGILFHLLIIGLTLGVTPDDNFTTLLIALCFHQTFEGIALGSMISSILELKFSH
ncbi:Zinc/iron permease [Globomyces pollinis-pini]|nr:Zinc/iron permease [Globomyces pollinis-pini]